MKKLLLLIFIVSTLIGCTQKNTTDQNQLNIHKNGFTIHGELINLNANTVYLNKIIDNYVYPIDSSTITNNVFKISGLVEYPERFALTFNNYSKIIILIVENTEISIIIDGTSINDPIIQGSPLNTALNDYKEASKSIFKKMDYLYPAFQKARLENDADKLHEIGNQLNNIEHEFTDFSYNFIKNNTHSYIAAMILNDHLKSSSADTLKIKKLYDSLSEEVKKCPDAQLIAHALNLH